MEENEGFLEKFVFSDRATFRVSGLVNRRNVQMWGLEPRSRSRTTMRLPKTECFLRSECFKDLWIIIFRSENSDWSLVSRHACPVPFPGIQQDTVVADILFPQHGAPPHYHCRLTSILDATFHNKPRWIDRVTATVTWPLTPLLFIPGATSRTRFMCLFCQSP